MAKKQPICKELQATEWFQSDTLQKLMTVLNGDEDDAVRLVGGCLRNVLLGHPVTDIDLATKHKPEEVVALLKAAEIKTILTGFEHGTVTAVINGQPFEITSLRRDIKTDGRHAVVDYTESWEEDAKRRDFTINALYADQAGRLYDYGTGLEDIKKGIIRFIGEPENRIKEDFLRILRFFRFHAWYGSGELDEAGLTACQKHAGHITSLSKERVRIETLKILAAPMCFPVVQAIKETGIWDHFLPEAEPSGHFEQYVREDQKTIGVHSIFRLAVLLENRAESHDLARRLRLSNHEKNDLINWQRAADGFEKESNLFALFYRFGKTVFLTAALFFYLKQGPKGLETYHSVYQDYHKKEKPVFPLKGQDLIGLGLEPGKRMGDILDQTKKWWLGQNGVPDHRACQKHAMTLIESGQ